MLCAKSQTISTYFPYSVKREYLMLLVAGWFDESTDETGQGMCCTVAGFIGTLEPAVVLDLRWRDMLRKYDLEYFKASEIEMGFGQFRKHRDDPSDPPSRYRSARRT